MLVPNRLVTAIVGHPRGWRCPVAASVVTVNDLLDGQVSLDVECLDRVYLNLYVPTLQVGGQVVSFCGIVAIRSPRRPACSRSGGGFGVLCSRSRTPTTSR